MNKFLNNKACRYYIYLLVAIVAASAVYLWQSSIAGTTAQKLGKANSMINSLQTQIKDKNTRIAALENENLQLKNTVENLRKNAGILEDAGGTLASDYRRLIITRSAEALYYLKKGDYKGFSAYIHPVKGVRFTAYAYINTGTDLVFTPTQISNAKIDTAKYTFGVFDGTGDPIKMTLTEYFKRFVYDVDFINAPQISLDSIIGRGNSLDNITEAYSGNHFIEFHFPGFEKKYNGMDWKSLKLVFEKKDNIWYIIGIVHSEWTI